MNPDKKFKIGHIVQVVSTPSLDHRYEPIAKLTLISRGTRKRTGGVVFIDAPWP